MGKQTSYSNTGGPELTIIIITMNDIVIIITVEVDNLGAASYHQRDLLTCGLPTNI